MFRTLTVAEDHSVSVSADPEDVGPGGAGQLRWIDLENQDEAALERLSRAFGFHPLTIEDCLHLDQRPKLETYDGYIFLVLHGFDVDWDALVASAGREAPDETRILELHFFIGPGYVVTVHQRPIPSLEAVWQQATRDGRLLVQGSDQIAYLIADALVDSYFPLLDDLSERVDQLEDRVLDPADEVSLGEILEFKRLLVELRKILSPQRDVLALLCKHGGGPISERVSVYFHDVYDHALRVHESAELVRELVGNVRDAYLWDMSQRTNEIMKRLTILSAIFLPLTFITGFFGQNFTGLPFDSGLMLFAMLATCIAVPTVMLFWFVRSNWF